MHSSYCGTIHFNFMMLKYLISKFLLCIYSEFISGWETQLGKIRQINYISYFNFCFKSHIIILYALQRKDHHIQEYISPKISLYVC